MTIKSLQKKKTKEKIHNRKIAKLKASVRDYLQDMLPYVLSGKCLSTFPFQGLNGKIAYYVTLRETKEHYRLNPIDGYQRMKSLGPSDVLITYGGYSYLIGYSVD